VIIPFFAIRDASLNLDDLNQLESTPVAQMDFMIPLAPAQGPRELAVQLRFGRPPYPWNAVGEATEWGNQHILSMVESLNVRAYVAKWNLAFVVEAACRENEKLQKARSLTRMSFVRIHQSYEDYKEQVGILWASRKALFLHFKRMGPSTRRSLKRLLPNWRAGAYRSARSPGKSSSMEHPDRPKFPLPERELLKGSITNNGVQIAPPHLYHLDEWRRLCFIGGINEWVFPWLRDDRVPNPSQLEFYNRVVDLARFIVLHEEQTAAVQDWRKWIRCLTWGEQSLAKYWLDSFLSNQKLYLADLLLRQEEDKRFRRLLLWCHPGLSSRLAAKSSGPYSEDSLLGARASSSTLIGRAPPGELLADSLYASAYDPGFMPLEQRARLAPASDESFLEELATRQPEQLLPGAAVLAAEGLVCCTSASEVILALPFGSSARLDGLGYLASLSISLLGDPTVAAMPAPAAPALVSGAPGPTDSACARPAPSAPLWTAPLPAIGASPSCTIMSGLAASGHSLSRYPTGCGPTDSQVTVADSAWCQPRGSTQSDIPCRSTVFGRHWFANPSVEECLRVALPDTQLQGSSQVLTSAPRSVSAVAFPIYPHATTNFAVRDDGQSASTPRRLRVFECDLDDLD